MEHVAFIPSADQLNYTFGGAAPVMRIRPRTVLTLWTEDAYGGRITSRDDVATRALDTEDLNPQTGPFWIEGAEPGDTLAIHLADLTPARTWGASTLIPFFGGLTSIPASPTLQAPLPERTYIYEYDSAAGTLGFSAQGSDFTVDLPVNPMLGTVGVAPARREVRSSLVPEAFGGNMDTPEMAVGATCNLREYSRNQYPTAWGQITNVLASGCLPQPGAGHELYRRPFAAEEAHRVIDQRLERSGNLGACSPVISSSLPRVAAISASQYLTFSRRRGP